MAALGITAQDVIASFSREHVQLPGGYLVSGDLEKLLHLDLEYHSARELEELVVQAVAEILVQVEVQDQEQRVQLILVAVVVQEIMHLVHLLQQLVAQAVQV